MSIETKIEWADHTFNPWIGCTKVSPGCLHCYAERETRPRVLRARGVETWGHGAPRQRTSEATWKQPQAWNREAAREKVRPRVFPSMCDPFDWEVPVEWLADYLRLIYETPHLDWLLLTKRPHKWESRMAQVCDSLNVEWPREVKQWIVDWRDGVMPANVWMGTSVEDQRRAVGRIPELLAIPARVRFLSVEPLLEEVELGILEGINWVIVGGESGPKARECAVEWVRAVARLCCSYGVPCFVKQLGKVAVSQECGLDTDRGLNGKMQTHSLGLKHPKGGDMSEWPEDLRVRQFPRVEVPTA